MGLAEFVSVVISVVTFFWWRFVDCVCGVMYLLSFCAFWRAPWLLTALGENHRSMRAYCACCFGLSLLDLLLIPFCISCVTWRCPHILRAMDKKNQSRADTAWYNGEVRITIFLEFWLFLGDVITFVLLVFTHLTFWRIPTLWQDMNNHKPTKFRDHSGLVDYISVVLKNALEGIVDVLLLPAGVPILVTVYRVQPCYDDMKNCYHKYTDINRARMERKLCIINHFLFLLADIPPLVCGLVVSVTLWRLPRFISDMKAGWTDGGRRRREVCYSQFLFLLRDIPCFGLFILLIPSLFRFVKALMAIRRMTEAVADPTPVLDITSIMPEIVKPGETPPGSCPRITITGTKPADLCFKEATLSVPDQPDNTKFWRCVERQKGATVAWLIKQFLPLSMCPKFINPTHFVEGETEFTAVVKMPMKRTTFIDFMETLKTSNPELTMVMEYKSLKNSNEKGTLLRMRFGVAKYFDCVLTERSLPTTMVEAPADVRQRGAKKVCDVFWFATCEQFVKLVIDLLAIFCFIIMHFIPHRAIWMYTRLFERGGAAELRKTNGLIRKAQYLLHQLQYYRTVGEYSSEARVRTWDAYDTTTGESQGYTGQRKFSKKRNKYVCIGSQKADKKQHKFDQYLTQYQALYTTLQSSGESDLANTFRSIGLLLIQDYSAQLWALKFKLRMGGLPVPMFLKNWPLQQSDLGYRGDHAGIRAAALKETLNMTDSEFQEHIIDLSWIGMGSDKPKDVEDASLSTEQVSGSGSSWGWSASEWDSSVCNVEEENDTAEKDRQVARNRVDDELKVAIALFDSYVDGHKIDKPDSKDQASSSSSPSSWGRTKGIIFQSVSEVGMDIAATLVFVLLLFTVYRLPTTLSAMNKKYNTGRKRLVVLRQFAQIGLDVGALIEIVVVICFLKYSLVLPVLIVAELNRRGPTHRLRKIISRVCGDAINDFYWLLSLPFRWRFYKYFVCTIIWGVFSPSIVFNPLISKKTPKFISVCIIFLLAGALYLTPAYIMYGGLSTDHIQDYIYVYLLALMGCGGFGIILAFVSRDPAGKVKERMKYISATDWVNMITIFSLLLQLTCLTTIGISSIPVQGNGSENVMVNMLNKTFSKYIWLGATADGHTGWGISITFCILVLYYFIASLPLVILYILEDSRFVRYGGVEQSLLSSEWQCWIVTATVLSESLFIFVVRNLMSVLMCTSPPTTATGPLTNTSIVANATATGGSGGVDPTGGGGSGSVLLLYDAHQCWTVQHYKLAFLALIGLSYYLPTCMMKDIFYIKCQRRFFAVQFSSLYWCVYTLTLCIITVMSVVLQQHNTTLFIPFYLIVLCVLLLLSVMFPMITKQRTCSVTGLYYMYNIVLFDIILITVGYYLVNQSVIGSHIFTISCITIILTTCVIFVVLTMQTKKRTLQLTMDDLQEGLLNIESRLHDKGETAITYHHNDNNKDVIKVAALLSKWESKRKSWRYDVKKASTPISIIWYLYRLEQHTHLSTLSTLWLQERGEWMAKVIDASDGIVGSSKTYDRWYSNWYSRRYDYYFMRSITDHKMESSSSEDGWQQRIDTSQTLIQSFSNAAN